MQSLNCFYYPNAVELQLNLDPTISTRNRVVYQKTVKLYKGVDNVIRFTFKNSDQKPVNITGWVVGFNIIADDEGAVVVSKGVTTINANAGIVTATVSELDLMDLNKEFYNYSVSITDPYGSEQVVYADDNYGVRGEVQVLAGHYPMFKPSIQVSLPTNSNANIITSTVTADTPTRQQAAHHTAQIFFTGFSGEVEVQATLDSLPANGQTGGNTSLSWAPIISSNYANQTGTNYLNWDGVYTACRLVITTASGTLDKILYRA